MHGGWGLYSGGLYLKVSWSTQGKFVNLIDIRKTVERVRRTKCRSKPQTGVVWVLGLGWELPPSLRLFIWGGAIPLPPPPSYSHKPRRHFLRLPISKKGIEMISGLIHQMHLKVITHFYTQGYMPLVTTYQFNINSDIQ